MAASQAVLARISAILTDDFDVPSASVKPDAHLRVDLGLDSLALTDLAFLVQRDFGFHAAAEDFRGVTTVAALADLCARRLDVAPPAAASDLTPAPGPGADVARDGADG